MKYLLINHCDLQGFCLKEALSVLGVKSYTRIFDGAGVGAPKPCIVQGQLYTAASEKDSMCKGWDMQALALKMGRPGSQEWGRPGSREKPRADSQLGNGDCSPTAREAKFCQQPDEMGSGFFLRASGRDFRPSETLGSDQEPAPANLLALTFPGRVSNPRAIDRIMGFYPTPSLTGNL